jgi:hypothetical protein
VSEIDEGLTVGQWTGDGYYTVSFGAAKNKANMLIIPELDVHLLLH